MFYSFIVEIYKIVGMLKTHAFKSFSIDFNIFVSPSFIMAGGFTDFNVVVYSFFLIPHPLFTVNTLVEIQKTKDLKVSSAVFFD